jgi:hypothetical protein
MVRGSQVRFQFTKTTLLIPPRNIFLNLKTTLSSLFHHRDRECSIHHEHLQRTTIVACTQVLSAPPPPSTTTPYALTSSDDTGPPRVSTASAIYPPLPAMIRAVVMPLQLASHWVFGCSDPRRRVMRAGPIQGVLALLVPDIRPIWKFVRFVLPVRSPALVGLFFTVLLWSLT